MVEEALHLRQAQDALGECIQECKQVLCDVASDPIEVDQAGWELPALQQKHQEGKVQLLCKEAALGIEGREKYRNLGSNKFLNLRINAHAKKI